MSIFGHLSMIITTIIMYAIPTIILYFVIRLAVKHAINDAKRDGTIK